MKPRKRRTSTSRSRKKTRNTVIWMVLWREQLTLSWKEAEKTTTVDYSRNKINLTSLKIHTLIHSQSKRCQNKCSTLPNRGFEQLRAQDSPQQEKVWKITQQDKFRIQHNRESRQRRQLVTDLEMRRISQLMMVAGE